jgi:hypothetical protein
MRYWKKVYAGDYLSYSKKILDYGKENINFEKCPFWNQLNLSRLKESVPELFEGVAEFGEPKVIALLYIRMYDASTVHIDHTVGLNFGVQARLNIPILNTEGTRTAFYELPMPQVLNFKSNSDGTKFWPQSYKTRFSPITEVEVDSPTILRTSAVHSVKCPPNAAMPRITLTIAFQEDLVKYLDIEDNDEEKKV